MTKYQIDPRLHSESDLARHLLTSRGVHWMHGERGAPLSLILRGHGYDPRALHDELRSRPGLRPSHVGIWVTAAHTTAATVLDHPALTVRDTTLTRRRPIYTNDADTAPKHILALDDSTLALERHAHDRLLHLTGPVLGTGALGARTPRIASVFEEHAARLTGPFDLMTDYARPGVLTALAGLLAVPGEHLPRLGELTAGTGAVLDTLLCPQTLASTQQLVTSYDALKTLLTGEPATHTPPDGTQDTADPVTAALLTLTVGTHLTANLICSTVLALLGNPAELALLRADPTLAPAAVEETLRHTPPMRIASRIAAADTDIAGTPVRAGDQVAVLIDAANRDPAVFEAPHTYRIRRTDRAAHLTLNDLTTRLLAPAVRTLAAEAVRALTTGLPGLEPAGTPVWHIRSPVVGSLARCPAHAG